MNTKIEPIEIKVMPYCQFCKYTNDPDAKYCNNCGAALLSFEQSAELNRQLFLQTYGRYMTLETLNRQ